MERVSELFNTLLFTQQEEEEQEEEVRVSQLFNTLLFTQQQEEEQEQEVRVSQLFNTLLFTQQEEQEEQEVRVSQLFNTLHFTQQQEQEVRVSEIFNTLLFTQQQLQQIEENTRGSMSGLLTISVRRLEEGCVQERERLREALCDIGFFYITDCGLREGAEEDMRQTAQRLFAMPLEMKEDIHISRERHFRGWSALGESCCGV